MNLTPKSRMFLTGTISSSAQESRRLLLEQKQLPWQQGGVLPCSPALGPRVMVKHAPVPVRALAVGQASADPSPADRMAILTRHGVNHIWWGSAEWALAASELASISGLRKTFSQGAVQVWVQTGQRDLCGRKASKDPRPDGVSRVSAHERLRQGNRKQ